LSLSAWSREEERKRHLSGAGFGNRRMKKKSYVRGGRVEGSRKGTKKPRVVLSTPKAEKREKGEAVPG